MKVEVAVLGYPALISLIVSVDVKQHNYTFSAFTRPTQTTESERGFRSDFQCARRKETIGIASSKLVFFPITPAV